MGAGVRFLRSGSFRVPSSVLVPNFVSNHVPSLFGYFLLLPRCRFRRLFWPFFRVWYVEGARTSSRMSGCAKKLPCIEGFYSIPSVFRVLQGKRALVSAAKAGVREGGAERGRTKL